MDTTRSVSQLKTNQASSLTASMDKFFASRSCYVTEAGSRVSGGDSTNNTSFWQHFQVSAQGETLPLKENTTVSSAERKSCVYLALVLGKRVRLRPCILHLLMNCCLQIANVTLDQMKKKWTPELYILCLVASYVHL